MERLRWEKRDGKDIFVIDISDMHDNQELLKVIEEARKSCMQQPDNSRLSVTYVKGTHFNRDVIEAMKKFAYDTEMSSKKAAVAGVEGLQKVMFSAVQKFSGRHFELYDTLEEALEALSRE